MISFENTEVMNLKGAIRGMRNPLNSWEKSDSVFRYGNCNNDCPDCKGCTVLKGMCFKLGENDLDLARRLIAAGSDHRKFLRQIFVSVDIAAPLYWWKEFDTYKVGTVVNSCSTMHKIAAKEFTLDDFSHDHLITVEDYPYSSITKDKLDGDGLLCLTINVLNFWRKKYIKTKDKKYWWQMIQLLPSSYNQKRTVMLNYEVLAGIYPMRKNHKLDEWVEFCKWIETLPYSEIIVGEKVKFYADEKEINI